MATHISSRRTQFQYFDQLLERPAWKRSTILDFGGNVGGFLVGAGNDVDHNKYWCLDITGKAIEVGRRRFPRAHFEHYNRYSSYFNPDGIRNLPVPDLGVKFDIIVAFSVFTHTHQKEMIELVAQLRRMLARRGVVSFTFCDPCYDRSLADHRLPSGAGVIKVPEQPEAHGSILQTEGTGGGADPLRWCVEVDGTLDVEPGVQLCQQERRGRYGESYCSYFTADYMASLFPDAMVQPPVSPEWQHCCTLRNTEYPSE